ncbi:hypothetical protein HOE04_04360 [archaeon]|jgi:preprotein translocase subunit SecG|nr:hypothetical protein [archaeon]
MEVKKSYLCLVIISLLILTLISNVSAITGSIGNARMILRDKTVGDSIDKYVLVKNVNDVSVEINVSASGDLEKHIDITDDYFILGPGEEKKAQFIINVGKPGTTESVINVLFAPVDGGNGVGLKSTVIVLAEDGPGFIDKLLGDNSGDGSDSDSATGDSTGKSGIIKIFLSITAIIFLILVILLYFAGNKPNKEIKDDKIKSKKSSKDEK